MLSINQNDLLDTKQNNDQDNKLQDYCEGTEYYDYGIEWLLDVLQSYVCS